MDNKSDEKFIIIQAAIESNNQDMRAAIEANNQDMRARKQDSDEKMTEFKKMLAVITTNINNLVSSPTNKDLPKPPDPTTVVPDNRRASSLGGERSKKLMPCGL